jgi:hypothetical protein
MTERVKIYEALEKARSDGVMDELEDFSLDVGLDGAYLALRTSERDVFVKLSLNLANVLVDDIVSQVFEGVNQMIGEMQEMQEEQRG